MKLSYRKLGQGKPIVILHGLFGSSDNWLSMAKRFSSSFELFLLDLRNHGASPHSDTHDYDSMAEDLKEFLEEHKLENIILIGHSMGGKVAMKFSVENPDMISKLIVIDMSPREYRPSSKYIIEALLALDLSKIKTREEAEIMLSEKIKGKVLRSFILKNLVRNDDLSFRWRLNLESLNKNLASIGGKFSEDNAFLKDTLFIKGENSNYINENDYQLIKNIFPNSIIEKVSNAGHWVHTDQPEKVYEVLKNFL